MILCEFVHASALRAAAAGLPQAPLLNSPSPVDELPRLAAALECPQRLMVKRDDAIPFGFGGNKIRKLVFVAGEARAAGADTLITCGGVQSNHARATAAAAAKLGMRAVLVANGMPPGRLSGNALLDRLLGATVHHVAAREDRAPAMERIADAERAAGRRPFIIPLGASTPLGAIGFALAVAELSEQIEPPDVIVHASSSGGTQAGLVAGCRALGWSTRVIGVSADEPAAGLSATVTALVSGIAALLPDLRLTAPGSIDVDDRFIGEGYGIPSAASLEAQAIAATTEALFLDHTYTAKAMAGLIARCRERSLGSARSILFWHTGGQPGIFA